MITASSQERLNYGKPPGKRTVLVFDKTSDYLSFIRNTWQSICSESLQVKKCVDVALSGGNTPVEVYRSLASEKQTLPWENIHIFMVDERFVAHDDKDSNFGLVRKTLLDPVPIPTRNIYPIETNAETPAGAAQMYRDVLLQHFSAADTQIPRFDLVMLGVGEDGHTASIFSESYALDDGGGSVCAVSRAGVAHDRITLTMRVINNSRHILLLVRGASKASILRRILNERTTAVPASLIEPVDGSLLILSDREAASLLAGEANQ